MVNKYLTDSVDGFVGRAGSFKDSGDDFVGGLGYQGRRFSILGN